MMHRRIVFKTSPDVEAGLVSDILVEAGAISVTVSDAHVGSVQEDPVYGSPSEDGTIESPSNLTKLWRCCSVTAIFPNFINVEAISMQIATDFLLEEPPLMSIEHEISNPNSWIPSMQAHLRPMQLPYAYLHFPWQQPIPGSRNIVLNGGGSFGTGDHATTQLCLGWLNDVLVDGDKVLDCGTGSGVLAVFSALRRKDIQVQATDIDLNALAEARKTAKCNGVADIVRFSTELGSEKYSVIVANILAVTLMDIAKDLANALQPGGRIGLSGILSKQAMEVSDCYRRLGVEMEQGKVQASWTILSGQKKST